MFMAWNFTCIWNFSLCHPLVSKRDINLGWERWAHWSRRIGLKAFASWCHRVSNLQFRYHSLGGFKEKGMTTITVLVRNSFSPVCCTEVISPTTERTTGILNGKGWCWQISCNGHFLVPVVCVWWCKMALKYFSCLPKYVPEFMSVFHSVISQCNFTECISQGKIPQVHKSLPHVQIQKVLFFFFTVQNHSKLAPQWINLIMLWKISGSVYCMNSLIFNKILFFVIHSFKDRFSNMSTSDLYKS